MAFAPTLAGPFLNYDDPWLIVENPLLAAGAMDTPARAFFDFSLPTRLALGAEYLPVRDCLVWLQTRAFGRTPEPMHAVSLGFYVAAVLALYGALRRTLTNETVARAAVLLFALHPVHVESVAWLSGQKDVFGLCFGALALYSHARGGPRSRGCTAALLLAACLSKAMSVALLPIFFAHDRARQRPLDPWLYGASGLVALFAVALQAHVGALVGMVAEPAGGTRLSAAMTMGPVFVRYLGLALFPTGTSIVHSVPDLGAWCWPSLAGYALCAGWAALAVLLRRRDVALGWAWFWLPLAPVSQILVPLQNRMADRYLWWSVLGPALVCAGVYAEACARAPRPATQTAMRTLAGLALVSLGLVSFERSVLFTDSVLLFNDALHKAPSAPLTPYQLGKAWEERGDERRAAEAFAEAMARAESLANAGQAPDEILPRAANNLARIYFHRGELDAADATLTRAAHYFPNNTKVRSNQAKVREARVRAAERAPPER